MLTSGANLYGFYKSSAEARSQLNAGINRYGFQALRGSFFGGSAGATK